MSLSQEAKNKIDNLVIAIRSLITEHYNITGSSSKKGHTQAGGVPQTIGTSLSAGTDNGYYARADHIHTVSYDKVSGTPNLNNLLEEQNTKMMIIAPKDIKKDSNIKIKAIPIKNNLIIANQQINFFLVT